MEMQRHNRLKAANERVQSVVHLDSAEREQARTQFNISTVSRWMTNRSALWDACQSKKVQPSVEQFYEIAHHLDVDVRELLVSSKLT